MTLRRYPGFDVKLAKGLFWFYFDQNDDQPFVQQEQESPCSYLDLLSNNGYLFKVLYYNNRISLEIFHSLTDGTGAIEFLKTLVYQYLKLKGAELSADSLVRLPGDLVRQEEMEDGFRRYSTDGKALSRKEENAYRLKGTFFEDDGVCVVTGTLPLSQMIKIAREKNTTITGYVASLLIYSIYSKQIRERKVREPVKISIPVNLRSLFPTKTLRNFSSFLNVGIKFDREYTLQEIIDQVSEQLKNGVTKERMIPWINANVKLEKNPVVRFVPLFIKNVGIRVVFNRSGENLFTSTLSNLGKVQLPVSMQTYVRNIEFMLGATDKNKINCAMCSYRDKLNITFSRSIVEADVVRKFFRYLAEEGVRVKLSGNGWGDRV